MKIKCPACNAVLTIPPQAAGKVVKCKCGKQMRAPVPKAAAPQQAAAPAATAAAAQPGAQPGQPAQGFPPQQAAAGQMPAQQPAQPYVSPFLQPDKPSGPPSVLDELTDEDLKPVAAVKSYTEKKKRPAGSASKALGNYVSEDDKAELDNVARRRAAQSAPAILRVLAYMIDWTFMTVPPIAFLIGYNIYMASTGDVDAMEEDEPIWVIVVFFCLCIGMTLLNGAILGLRGQSPGKFIFGLVVVDASTLLPVNFYQGCIVRMFGWQTQKVGRIRGAINQFMDIWQLFFNEGITRHDEYANTYVIRRRDLGKMG